MRLAASSSSSVAAFCAENPPSPFACPDNDNTDDGGSGDDDADADGYEDGGEDGGDDGYEDGSPSQEEQVLPAFVWPLAPDQIILMLPRSENMIRSYL